MTHTPGTWFVSKDGCWIVSVVEPTMFASSVARVDYAPPGDIRKANANLIAAAPDMLAALKVAADVLRYYAFNGPRLTQIETVIAKAEGREP